MRIPLPMFTAPGYGDRTLNDVQRCVNMYPEKTVNGYKLVGVHGLILAHSVANGEPCRGYHVASNGVLYSVHGNTLYSISTVSSTSIGTLNTSSGLVSFASSNTEMMIADGTNGYRVDLTTPAVVVIADANYPDAAPSVTYQDGYFIVGYGDQFYLSQLNDATDWTPIQFASAESNGDEILWVHSTGQELYILGERTIEVWYNTGNPSFPFERINGATLGFGLATAQSLATRDKSLFFQATGTGFEDSFWEIGPGGKRKISTPDIDSRSIASLSAYCYEFNGHAWYVVNAATSSWAFNISQGDWHERDSNVSGSYTTNRVRGIANRVVNSSPIAFDSVNGAVYLVSSAGNDEGGTAIRRRRVFGPVEAGASRMFHHSIRFVLEADHDASASYTLSADLDWSDDGGLSWSTARTLSKAITSGTTGQRVMLEAHRLGSSRQRYYRLTFTGPAARLVLQSAELDADVGRN